MTRFRIAGAGLALVAACAGSMAHGQGRSAGVRGNPAIFFGPEAYPPEAARLGQQGRVVAKLSVDASGKVVGCVVDVSSGSPALDKTTCDIALSKMTFQPALDERGKPIVSTYTLPVRWALPETAPPIEIGSRQMRTMVKVVVKVDPNGLVRSCDATILPGTGRSDDPCAFFKVGEVGPNSWTRAGTPVGGTFTQTFTYEFVPDPASVAPDR